MPVTYHYDTNIVVLALVGEYSVDELHSALLKSLEDPQCPSKPCLLIDLTASESIQKRSSDQVNSMARFVGSLGQRFSNRIAMVASRDLHFGLVRMGSAGAEERGVHTEVFRNIQDARKWLLL